MYTITTWTTTFLLLFSLDLDEETSINSQLSYIYNTFPQALDKLKKLERFSAILAKHMTVFGMLI